MSDALTRGELADRTGVGMETIRYYERRGLLPEPPRSSGGYRQYDPSYVDRLRFIRRAKELGFTLSEIGDLLSLRVDDGVDCGDVRREAQAKLDNVGAKLRDLQRIRAALSRLVDACEGAGPTSDCPILDVLQREASLSDLFPDEPADANR